MTRTASTVRTDYEIHNAQMRRWLVESMVESGRAPVTYALLDRMERVYSKAPLALWQPLTDDERVLHSEYKRLRTLYGVAMDTQRETPAPARGDVLIWRIVGAVMIAAAGALAAEGWAAGWPR